MARSIVVALGAVACAVSAALTPASGTAAVPRTYVAQATTPHRAPGAVATKPARDWVRPLHVPGLPEVSARATTTKRVRVLVLRVHWNGKPPSYPDDADMRDMMKSTAAWFAHASRGRQHLSSKITPWLVIGGATTNCVEQRGPVQRAIAAARRRGIGTGGFNRYMIVMPQCSTNSLGEMPGRITWIREARPYPAVLVHELGHNLGLDHAHSLICTAQKRRVTQSGHCVTDEYGDLWDEMGLSSRQYSVAVLKRLGWAGRVATATSSGRWTLTDAEHSGSGLQGLRVKVSASTSYWLEYRTDPHALEKWRGSFPITGTPGLEVRLDDGSRSLRLLDAAPGNPDPNLIYPDPDFVNAALPVGSSFTTPGNVRITLVSQDATTATVQVTRGSKASKPPAPTLQSVLRRTTEGQVELTVQPPSTDNGQVLLGYVVTRYPDGKSKFVADPGGTKTTINMYDLGSGAGPWTVRAVNQEGASAESARVTGHDPVPVLHVTAPLSGAQIATASVTVTADAMPDPVSHAAITQVRACLQTAGDCVTDSTAPYAFSLTTYTRGPDVVTVTAIDADSKQTEVDVPVTFVPAPPSVHLDSPLEGAAFNTGDVITLSATATPNPGTQLPVDLVGFKVFDSDNVNVFDDLDASAPYGSTWNPYQPGTYRVEAQAQSGDDLSTVSSVTITVN
jgi:hypothetical protein